jgi:hypothetical protein
MFLEIAMIQCSLFLSHPVYAVAVSLSAFALRWVCSRHSQSLQDSRTHSNSRRAACDRNLDGRVVYLLLCQASSSTDCPQFRPDPAQGALLAPLRSDGMMFRMGTSAAAACSEPLSPWAGITRAPRGRGHSRHLLVSTGPSVRRRCCLALAALTYPITLRSRAAFSCSAKNNSR